MGGFCITPLSAWLIFSLGLEQATLWLALMYILGVVPVTLMFTRSHPDALGLRPDGDTPVAGKPSVADIFDRVS